MMNRTLKRRRPLGPEASPLDAGHQGFSSSSQPDFGFYNLPHELQRHLDAVAAVYDLPGRDLHQALLSIQARKRRRSEHMHIMYSQDSVGSFIQGSPDGSSSFDGNKYHEDGSDLAIASAQPGHLQCVTSGLANLKLIFCPGCFSQFQTSQGYEGVPQSSPVDYGTNTPYTAEKPLSAQFSANDAYMSLTESHDQPPAFAGETGLAGNLHYANIHHGSTATLQSPEQGSSFFSPDAWMPTFHNSQLLVGNESPVEGFQSSVIGRDQLLNHGTGAIPFERAMGSIDVSSSFQGQYACVPESSSQIPVSNTYETNDVTIRRGDLHAQSGSQLSVFSGTHKPPAAKRGPFKDTAMREQTAQTRRIGSCIRCRMQRVRCKANEDDQEGECLNCVKKSSSKVWRLPCLRVKITDVRLFKPGQVSGLEWTKRWSDKVPGNINSWASPDDRIIQISEGYTSVPVELRVRRFVPLADDKLYRTWVGSNGKRHEVKIPPFAIVTLDEARKAYGDHIQRCVDDLFPHFLDSTVGTNDDMMRRTYSLAWKLYQSPNTDPEERGLLEKALKLWVAIRLTTKSTYIVGKDTLGMARDIMPPGSPQHGEIPLPPVMGYQIDMVVVQTIQAALRRDLLERLQKMISHNKPATWLTTYLVIFILLHNASQITKHDRDYAVKHGLKRRWARESEVEGYQFGATILLSYFHYCNKGVFPFSEQCRDQDMRGLANLNGTAMKLISETREWVMSQRQNWDQMQREEQYEDRHYWVSQMYKQDWMPPIKA